MKTMQYTIRGVPERLDELVRDQAHRDGQSLNTALVEALKRGLGVTAEAQRYDDLDDLAGTWVDDPEFDKAIRDLDRVDVRLWQ
ncbi:MAG: hypothetical protein A3K19_13270 [Lentisphaerae bacterium RIFOXYB12_FULL_65_16]|nr:MAG: hypothetical protein A3K19_13270 [Lentisphaerae bacterium RIFOXYB12_FULL_65_16]